MTTATSTAPAERIQLHADGRPVQLLIVGASLLVAIAAFAAGVPALTWAMALAGVPTALAWLAPVVVDAGLVVAALALSVRRSQQRPARLESWTMISLTAVSVAVQAVHALHAAAGEPVPTLLVATIVAGLLPVVTLLAVELAVRAVLAEPTKRAPRTRANAASPAATAIATGQKPATPAPVASTKSAGRPATRPRPVVATSPTEPTMRPEAAAAEVVAGRMSGRAAALAAGVSRHRMTALVADLTGAQAA